MLTFEGVSLTRRNPDGEVPVLRDLSFSVPEGRVFAVLGPSAAGKAPCKRSARVRS